MYIYSFFEWILLLGAAVVTSLYGRHLYVTTSVYHSNQGVRLRARKLGRLLTSIGAGGIAFSVFELPIPNDPLPIPFLGAAITALVIAIIGYRMLKYLDGV